MAVPGGVWFKALVTRLPKRLAQMGLDAQDDHGLGGVKGDRPAGCGRSGVAAGVGGQDGEVDGARSVWPHLVQAGQQQQVLHEPLHPGRLLLDPPHDGGLVDPGVLCAQAEQLGETLDRRERRPQFVGRIGQELPEPALGGVPLGESLLDLVEHGIEGDGQFAHLGTLLAYLDPLR